MKLWEQQEERCVFRVLKGPPRWSCFLRRIENGLERWDRSRGLEGLVGHSRFSLEALA